MSESKMPHDRATIEPATSIVIREWMRETAAVARLDVENLTREQRQRLERMADPLIMLMAARNRGNPDSPVYNDAVLVELLAKQARDDARREWHRPGSDQVDESERRRALSCRMVVELQSARLHVKLASKPPASRRLPQARMVDRGLLRAMERTRHAVALDQVSVAAGGGREVWEQESDRVVEVPDTLPAGPYVALTVSGDSMEPLLADGDGVLVRLETAVRAGSVVVARDPEHGYVVKELAAMDQRGLELRSLNPAYAPRRIAHAPGAVLGTVLMRWRVPPASG